MELRHPLMHDGTAHAQDEDAGYASESTVHVFHDEADEPSAEDADADAWGFEWVSSNWLHVSNPNYGRASSGCKIWTYPTYEFTISARQSLH
jgi:hypothetical protein